MQKITPFLWFDGQAEEAAHFYVSTFKNSSIKSVFRQGEIALTVGFELDGQHFTALNGGPHFKFTEAVSFVVNCDSQAEVDDYWEKLTANGGQESQCGWLKDKYGLSWQIVPTELPKLLSDPNPGRAQRAMSAMMQMRKIDLEKLRQAADDDNKTVITIQATVNAPLEKVWELWTLPEHITQWNNASEDWHTPRAENDLRAGGRFSCRMEAKDGSMGFDFGGVYDLVQTNARIEYTMDDGRKVQISFDAVDNATFVLEAFEAESMNPVELQQGGWQAILNNFKQYAEGHS